MMRRIALFAVGLVLVLPVAGLKAQPSRDRSLRATLQSEFRESRSSAPDTRYVSAWADLDGDRRPEAIVYLLSRDYCGTGGCNLLVYRAAGRSWRLVARMTVSNPPIRVLNTRSHGWRDLAIGQRELRDEHLGHYEARLRFNGRTYPLNPSVPPAERLTRRVPGQVLIAENDRGRRLF